MVVKLFILSLTIRDIFIKISKFLFSFFPKRNYLKNKKNNLQKTIFENYKKTIHTKFLNRETKKFYISLT